MLMRGGHEVSRFVPESSDTLSGRSSASTWISSVSSGLLRRRGLREPAFLLRGLLLLCSLFPPPPLSPGSLRSTRSRAADRTAGRGGGVERHISGQVLIHLIHLFPLVYFVGCDETQSDLLRNPASLIDWFLLFAASQPLCVHLSRDDLRTANQLSHHRMSRSPGVSLTVEGVSGGGDRRRQEEETRGGNRKRRQDEIGGNKRRKEEEEAGGGDRRKQEEDTGGGVKKRRQEEIGGHKRKQGETGGKKGRKQEEEAG